MLPVVITTDHMYTCMASYNIIAVGIALCYEYAQ